MKKTQFIELINNIKKTKVSFISIAIFIALGIAVFTGMTWISSAIGTTMDQELEQSSFRDFSISYPYGYKDEDIKKISKIDGVDEIEGTQSTCQFLFLNDKKKQVKIVQMTNKIDKLLQVEGKLPSKKGEIALEGKFAKRYKLKIGDSIKFEKEDLNLKKSKFKVTAIVESPAYLSKAVASYGVGPNSIAIDGIMFCSEKAFDQDEMLGYTELLIKSNDKNLEKNISESLDKITDERFEDINAEIESKREEIREELRASKNRLNSAENKLASLKSQYRNGKSRINSAKAKLQKKKQQLKRAGLYKGETAAKIKRQEAQLNSQAKSLKSAPGKIKKMESQVNRGRQQYQDAEAEAQDKLEDLEDVKEYDYSIQSRPDNIGINSLTIVIDSLNKLRYSMALLFLIVGLLVCYSAVSRIVYDDTNQIGTKKALGIGDAAITFTYLAYSGAAIFIGAVLGVVMAVWVVQPALFGSFQKSFVLYNIQPYFDWKLALLSVCVEFVLIMLCTYIACRKTLRKEAVELLAGKTQQVHDKWIFEDWKLWNKKSTLTKTIISNLISDKRRVFATLVGVIGCTALIVSATMLRNDINKSFTKQYSDVFKFKQTVSYTDGDRNEKNIKKAVSKKDIESTAVMSDYCLIDLPDDTQMFAEIFVPTDENFEDYVQINPRKQSPNNSSNGVWLNDAYASYYGVKPGDKIKIIDEDGQNHELKISGFYEYYLTRYQFIIDEKTYSKEFDKKVESNLLLLENKKIDTDELENVLSDVKGFVSLDNYYQDSREFFNAFTSVSKALVAVYLALSVILALLVLLNLYTMYVSEKKKDIIVLMINGYSVADAKRYITRDTIILTVTGIIIGIIFGTFMGAKSISAFENNVTHFIKNYDVIACILGAIVSGFLSTLMMKIASNKIDKFKLHDINT